MPSFLFTWHKITPPLGLEKGKLHKSRLQTEEEIFPRGYSRRAFKSLKIQETHQKEQKGFKIIESRQTLYKITRKWS